MYHLSSQTNLFIHRSHILHLPYLSNCPFLSDVCSLRSCDDFDVDSTHWDNVSQTNNMADNDSAFFKTPPLPARLHVTLDQSGARDPSASPSRAPARLPYARAHDPRPITTLNIPCRLFTTLHNQPITSPDTPNDNILSGDSGFPFEQSLSFYPRPPPIMVGVGAWQARMGDRA